MNIPSKRACRGALPLFLLLSNGPIVLADTPPVPDLVAQLAQPSTPGGRGSGRADSAAQTQGALPTLNDCVQKASSFAATTFFDLDRAQAFEAVATVQYKAGDATGARRTLAEARHNIEAEDFKDIRPGAYLHLAETYERGGDRDLALLALESGVRDASTAKDPHLRGLYLLPLAEAQAATWELLNKAAHEEQVSQGFDLAELAGALARAGKLTAARTIAGGISHNLDQSCAWQSIAEAQLRAHDINSAFRTATLISCDWIAQDTLAKIATAQADAGDLLSAETTARRLTADTARSDALVAIVRAHLRRHDFDTAASAAAAISDPSAHIRAAHALAQAAMKAGNIDAARKFAAAAIKDAGQIDPDMWDPCCVAFCHAAKVQAQVGDFAAARKCFDAARRATDKANGNDPRWEGIRKWKLVRTIALTQLETGDTDGAKATISTMNTDNAEGDKALACQAVALALTRSEGISATERWINTVDSNRARSHAWTGAAEALLAGDSSRTVHN